jgi:hypothetical protein
MAFFIGRDREARRAYGFDEVALVPGTVTVNPEDTDVSTRIGSVKLQVPILASAMDGVVDVEFAVAMGTVGWVGGVEFRRRSKPVTKTPNPSLRKFRKPPRKRPPGWCKRFTKNRLKKNWWPSG